MSHREMTDRLPDFVSGQLGDADHTEMQHHLEACGECRDWIETFAFFRDTLGVDGDTTRHDHPSSTEIAEWAILSEELPTSARRHLEACSSCDGELTMTRQAILAARTQDSAGRESHAGVEALASPARLAIAAGIVVAVLAGGILLRPSEEERGNYRVKKGDLVGKQVIDFSGSIEAGQVRIDSGSDISFRARDSVVFSDGFAVGPNATLTVEVARPSASDRHEDS